MRRVGQVRPGLDDLAAQSRLRTSGTLAVAARTAGSTGSPPASGDPATRTPRRSRSSEPAKTSGDSWVDTGERTSGPRQRSQEERHVGHGPGHRTFDRQWEPGVPVSVVDGTRPGDGRKPTILQNAAGLRSEPPRSEPSHSGSIRAASATAAPPLEPPHVLVTSYGLRVDAEHRIERVRTRAELGAYWSCRPSLRRPAADVPPPAHRCPARSLRTAASPSWCGHRP